jgi:TP901 family phage tail tape measure protein
MGAETLFVNIKAIDQFSGTFARLGGQVAGAEGKLQAVGAKMMVIGSQLTKSVTLPVVAVGAASVVAFANFDDAMTKSISIMGDVSDAMKNKMEKAAREVGKTTTFSATEAADAYFYLASAGLSAEQSIAAMPEVAAFATAGNFDLARATDLLTDAQSALGLTVSDVTQNMQNMTQVSDVLVKANTLANASVEQFSEALTTRAGAALRLLNKDIEEGVAVLAVFADQGVKGAEAGTRLDIVLRDLQTASQKNRETWDELGIKVYDASGKMLGMADIIQQLEGLLGGMSDEQKRATLMQMGFTDRSVAATSALMGTSDQIRKYEDALRDAGGTTKDVAGKQLESFKAQMTIIKDKLVDAGISIGSVLAPKLQSLAKFVSKAVDWFSKLSPKVQNSILAIAGIAAAIGPVLFVGGKLITMVSRIGSVISGISGLVSSAIGLFGGMSTSMNTLGGVAQGVTTPLLGTGKAMGDVGTQAGKSAFGMGSMLGVVAPLAIGVAAVGAATYLCWDADRKAEEERQKNIVAASDLTGKLDALRVQTNSLTYGTEEHAVAMQAQAAAAVEVVEKVSGIGAVFDAHGKVIDANTQLINLMAEGYRKGTKAQTDFAIATAKGTGTLDKGIDAHKDYEKSVSQAADKLATFEAQMYKKLAAGEEISAKEHVMWAAITHEYQTALQAQSGALDGMTKAVEAFGKKLTGPEGLSAVTESDLSSMVKAMKSKVPEIHKQGMAMFQKILDAGAASSPAIQQNMQAIMDGVSARIAALPAGQRTAEKMQEIINEEIAKYGPITAEMQTIVDGVGGVIGSTSLAGPAATFIDSMRAGMESKRAEAVNTARSIAMAAAHAANPNLYGPGFHGGGQVLHGGGPVRAHGGRAMTDERPAILQTGEFVVQRKAVKQLGVRTLNAINQGQAGNVIHVNFNSTFSMASDAEMRRAARKLQKYLAVEGAR